ncbi:hypothetical protein QUB70_32190 [Microcoleus sp. A003_D6]
MPVPQRFNVLVERASCPFRISDGQDARSTIQCSCGTGILPVQNI